MTSSDAEGPSRVVLLRHLRGQHPDNLLGTRPELAEVLCLGAQGLIESKIIKYSLDRAADAYRALKAGEIERRAVVVPNNR